MAIRLLYDNEWNQLFFMFLSHGVVFVVVMDVMVFYVVS